MSTAILTSPVRPRVAGPPAAPRAAFTLFVLLNALLLIRPAEVIPELLGVPLYELAIVTGLLAALPTVAGRLSPQALAGQPLSVCLLGLLAAAALSHLAHLDIREAVQSAVRLAKVLVYYLLLVSVLDSVARLRRFLAWQVVFILALTAVALLHYYGIAEIEAISLAEERAVDEATEDVVTLRRICAVGIFNNPNDLSRILVVGMLLSLYARGTRAAGAARHAWLVPVLIFGFTLSLTHSRGGLLALGTGLLVLFHARYGLAKALFLAGAALPLLLVLFAGRQTELSTEKGTGQHRVQLWSAGFAGLRESPLFGTGMDTYGELAEGYVAHNSFVHAYTELGLFGGTCFVAACFAAFQGLRRPPADRTGPADAELTRVRPYLLAVTVSYAVGMLTSSRCYEVPTYLFLSLGAVHLRLWAGDRPPLGWRFDRSFVRRACLVSVAVLAATYVFVRLTVRWG